MMKLEDLVSLVQKLLGGQGQYPGLAKTHMHVTHGKAHDHVDLTNVTADQHHAQAHTLTSHSTRAHSELTGVGADDHHAASHTLTSHSTRAHSELTGVGADDHHAQTHTHASHSSIGADDHHAQAHHAAHEPAGADAMAVDAAAGTGSLRTLGTGATTAAAGNHTHTATTAPTLVRKTADETVNNSNVLQNDDELVLTVAANEVWAFEVYVRVLVITTGAAPGIKWDFAIPAAAGGTYQYIAPNTTATSISLTTGQSASAITANYTLHMTGVYIGGANAGSLQFRWAQSSATAENTKVLANSYIIAHKLA